MPINRKTQWSNEKGEYITFPFIFRNDEAEFTWSVVQILYKINQSWKC